jgi:hypothetical protein
MFVPRALRLKGVQEKQRPKPSKPPPAQRPVLSKDDELVDAMEGISTKSPEPQPEHIDPKAIPRGPRFTVKPITPEYIAQLAAGIELIFSDYAHQEEGRSNWLQERYRTVDGEDQCMHCTSATQDVLTMTADVHLTALLDNINISTLKPEATQVLLRQALRDHPSHLLEIAPNGYHVRRKPSTYPPNFLSHNSFDDYNDDGLSFWDQRTIYIEPHLRNLCQTPAKVSHWLQEHGQLKSKWIPIQAVHTLHNSCAFVVLSGSVMHEDVWTKWRAAERPENWKVLTKVEHTKRTAEYVALLEKQNPRATRKSEIDTAKLPAIARPAALAMDVEVVPEYAEKTVQSAQPKAKRKRNRKKGDKADRPTGGAETIGPDTAAETAEDDEPSSKRRG